MLNLFRTIATINTAQDVTLQETSMETQFSAVQLRGSFWLGGGSTDNLQICCECNQSRVSR